MTGEVGGAALLAVGCGVLGGSISISSSVVASVEGPSSSKWEVASVVTLAGVVGFVEGGSVSMVDEAAGEGSGITGSYSVRDAGCASNNTDGSCSRLAAALAVAAASVTPDTGASPWVAGSGSSGICSRS